MNIKSLLWTKVQGWQSKKEFNLKYQRRKNFAKPTNLRKDKHRNRIIYLFNYNYLVKEDNIDKLFEITFECF